MAILVRERLGERQWELLIGGEAVAAQRGLRFGRDLARELERPRERPPGWHESVCEPHPQRLLAAHPAAREDQVERVAVAEQSREADRAAVHQRYAPAAAVDAEDRVVRGDAQVAPRRQLEAARDRVAFDRRDHRL